MVSAPESASSFYTMQLLLEDIMFYKFPKFGYFCIFFVNFYFIHAGFTSIIKMTCVVFLIFGGIIMCCLPACEGKN